MKAATHARYGPPEVVQVIDAPVPTPGPKDVQVSVAASAVTTADWRLRGAAFPGGLSLIGRLMFGFTGPRARITGVVFAGRIAALGAEAAGWDIGQRVYGFCGSGGHAETLVMPATGALAPTPDSLSDEEAASLPFGAASALVFLRDIARLEPGQSLLILGASGGVGAYAVQIAKALGATVTGVASGANEALVRSLGAEGFVDYQSQDITRLNDRFDAIFDTVGALRYPAARALLAPGGLFVPLNFGPLDLGQALWARLFHQTGMRLAVSPDNRATLEALSTMVAAGTLRPVVDRVLPLDAIVEAHRLVETRHSRGTLVLSIAGPHATA